MTRNIQVSISEAMDAYLEGKTIRMVVAGKFSTIFGKNYRDDNLMMSINIMTLDDVAKAEWFIELY